MKLPNGELAEISMEKLIGYCLNPEHSKGTQLRTIWEISLINPNPRLISVFIK